ncbi:nuclear transport factor 2 family protein [Flavobacterium sp. AC]|uniref:Nuclear transport factor 2 family protein n=1 Tax=Flavobacterium azizsancarii TaxID=2961580 RepID=A0ABT4WBE0_9FLAO|nr:nuclear transport factor 2 family protein [Flavobacterium azizsancarii]MDA6069445.1 nuclear transport factor 2 family protein [Flavobacterium azizsancarii]
MVVDSVETDKTADNKSQILEITRQLTQLMIERNTIEINAILDANFTLTHITGYVQSKEEWFSEIESERMKYYSFQEVKTSVTIDGDKAVFVGQNILDARIWGTRNNWRLQQTMQLEKRKGKWIILKSVATTF